MTISFVAEMATLQVLAGANLPSHTTPLPGAAEIVKAWKVGETDVAKDPERLSNNTLMKPQSLSRWFQIFFIFIPIWRRFPI